MGGPWHNRLVEVPCGVSLFEVEYRIVHDDGRSTMERAIYRACTCYSEYGTRYLQFVHLSLLQDGVPMPETLGESFEHCFALDA